MKRHTIIGLVIGAIALTSVSAVSLNLARSVATPIKSTNGSTMELKFNPPTAAEEAQQWQEIKQRFAAAGITLTPEQEIRIRQAGQQMVRQVQQNLGSDLMPVLGQLIAAATLPAAQGEALLKATGLDQRLATPILAYRDTILQTLTPEQRPLWEERIWKADNAQPQTQPEVPLTVSTPTPAEIAQEWQKTRQLFREAGVPLSPEQETQLQQANHTLQTALKREFEADPNGTFARFFALVLLPQPLADRLGENLIGSSIVNHVRTVHQILTPAQREVWDQSFSQNQ